VYVCIYKYKLKREQPGRLSCLSDSYNGEITLIS